MASKAYEYTLAVPAGLTPQIRIGTSSGWLMVYAERRADVLIAASHPATRQPGFGAEGALDLSALFRPSTTIILRCPERSDLLVGTASGKVRCEGPIGRLRATTASGSIFVEDARVLE